MAYPKSMTPPTPHRVVSTAKRRLWMPGANPLTRELTAAILRSYGLLEAPVPAGVLIHLARPIREAVRRRAATLRREWKREQDLARYREALRLARIELRDRLTQADVSAILDALQGCWFAEPWGVVTRASQVEDAIRLQGRDRKWHINGPGLIRLLAQLSYIESCALADAAERWWARVGAGEAPDPAKALND